MRQVVQIKHVFRALLALKPATHKDKKPKARRRKVMDAMSQAQGLDRRLYLTSE